MLKFENIFVPVDLSMVSGHAVKIAKSVLAAGGNLHVAHVLSRLPVHVQEVLFPYAPLGEDGVEFAWESLEAARIRVCRAHKLDDLDVQLGEPKVVLPELIARSGADLVVMGTFGDGAPYPDGMGSVAARVVRSSRQPVLLVRENHRNQIGNVLIASDLTMAAASVVRAALSVTMNADATIETLHVLPDPLGDDIHGFLRGQIRFDQRQAVSRSRDKIDALFERMVDEIDIPHPMKDQITRMLGKRRIHAGDPANEVLDRADRNDVDLIVVGSQRPNAAGRIRLGSVAQKIAQRAHCHVLVVPVDAQIREAQEE